MNIFIWIVVGVVIGVVVSSRLKRGKSRNPAQSILKEERKRKIMDLIRRRQNKASTNPGTRAEHGAGQVTNDEVEKMFNVSNIHPANL